MVDKNLDAQARAARERVELAVVERDPMAALAACDALDQLFHAGYTLWERPHASVTEAKPVLMAARYACKCGACGKQIAVDDFMWWQRGVSQGVDCDACGKRKGFKASAVSR